MKRNNSTKRGASVGVFYFYTMLAVALLLALPYACQSGAPATPKLDGVAFNIRGEMTPPNLKMENFKTTEVKRANFTPEYYIELSNDSVYIKALDEPSDYVYKCKFEEMQEAFLKDNL